jgi:hypothetical protein
VNIAGSVDRFSNYFDHELRLQEVPKFGQVIKSTCMNYTWNVFITGTGELATDTQIRPNPDPWTSMAKDFRAITTTMMERKISNFYFLDGGKVGAIVRSCEVVS